MDRLRGRLLRSPLPTCETSMHTDEMPAWSVVTASANPDKVGEIQALFTAVLPWVDLLPRPHDVADVVEDADTLRGNARLKARALVDATGMSAVSDDTGLFVDALGGDPGVFSARYAGPNATYKENCLKLVRELLRVGATEVGQRTARFITVALIAHPDGTETYFEGSVEGTIAFELRGSGGFGYDPLFIPDEGHGRTFSELGPAAKNALSHRGRAFRGLADRLATTNHADRPPTDPPLPRPAPAT